MNKPIIAVTPDCAYEPENARTRGRISLNWNYPEIVARAGGVPILVPPTADKGEIASLVHGWLIPGGADMDAARFGQENHPKAELQDPTRYDSEHALYNLVPTDLPVLGVCYGMQFLNVARGGDLIQHLPDAVGHGGHALGEIRLATLEARSRLAQIVGSGTVGGSSWHHQAVGTLGRGLSVTARDADGIVQAIEDPSLPFFVGVQWHPERTPDDAATQRLFGAFIEAARVYAETR